MSTAQTLLLVLSIFSLILISISLGVISERKINKHLTTLFSGIVSVSVFVIFLSAEIVFVVYYMKYLFYFGYYALAANILIILFIVLPAAAYIPKGIIPSGMIPVGIIAKTLAANGLALKQFIKELYVKTIKK